MNLAPALGRFHRPAPRLALLTLVTAGIVAGLGVATFGKPAFYRPMLAAAIVLTVIFLAVRWPHLAVLITFAFLPFLGLIRRLLITAAGWNSYDPLLLVAPVIAVVLLRNVPLSRHRPQEASPRSPLILGLLLLMILEAGNPLRGGGLIAGATGLLFLAAPILWFYVGREVADRRIVMTLLTLVLGCAVADALYGLRQTSIGLFPWDAAWVRVGGYSALDVYGQLRSFGTFSSSGEYAMYVGVGLVVAFAMALSGRKLAIPAIPLLAWALLLNSSRGMLLLAAVAMLVIAALRLPDTVLRVSVLVVGSLATIVVFGFLAPSLEEKAIASDNSFIIHQVFGLTRPLDPQTSTLAVHWAGLVDGFQKGITNPLGLGTAATNLASDKVVGTSGVGNEVDVSNAFVSLGLLGGLVVIAVIVTTFRRALRLYLRQPSAVALAVIGVLIATFGQWLNGGQYAVAPLVWFLIGWIAHESHRQAATTPQPVPVTSGL